MEIYKNQLNKKNYEIYGMPEASLESSKCLYRGSKSTLVCAARSWNFLTPDTCKTIRINTTPRKSIKTIKIYGKQWEPIEIYENLWNHIKSWNLCNAGSQPGIEQMFVWGQQAHAVACRQVLKLYDTRSMQDHQITWKSIKINKKKLKSMEINENPWNLWESMRPQKKWNLWNARSQPGIEQMFV